MGGYGLFGLLLLPLAAGIVALLAMRLARVRNRPVKLYPRPLLEHDAGALYERLRAALPQYVVLSRVSLAAFLDAKGRNRAQLAEIRRNLASQVVDFLICSEDYSIVAAIELDDVLRGRRSYEQSAHLLRQAEVPVLRWNSVNLPTIRDIQESVAELETLRLISIARDDHMEAGELLEIFGDTHGRNEPRL